MPVVGLQNTALYTYTHTHTEREREREREREARREREREREYQLPNCPSHPKVVQPWSQRITGSVCCQRSSLIQSDSCFWYSTFDTHCLHLEDKQGLLKMSCCCCTGRSKLSPTRRDRGTWLVGDIECIFQVMVKQMI